VKIKTKIKAGGTQINHNEKLAKSKKLTVKTSVKAGGIQGNHNEKIARGKKRSNSLTVKTSVKAGGIGTSPTVNHNETLLHN